MRNVAPTSNNEIADVTTAAAVSVRLRRKLAHVSRKAYAMRLHIIRTLLVLGRAQVRHDRVE